MRTQGLFSLLLVTILSADANAVNPASWDIENLTTTGNDVHWSSPTTVTMGLAEYDWNYTITKVEAQTFGFLWTNITSQLEDGGVPLTGGGTELGLPFVLLDESLDESGTRADFLIQVDAAGRGRASITNVTLGSYSGFDITGVRTTANFTVVGYPHGDYDRDRDVDMDDYSLWRQTFGSTANLGADGNRNSIVDAADYVLWRDHLGQVSGSGAGIAAVIPEPTSLAILMVLGGALLIGRRRLER